MDSDPIEIEDIGIFAALSVLLFLMVWVIRLLRNLDSTRVDKVCSGGPSMSLTQGQLTNLFYYATPCDYQHPLKTGASCLLQTALGPIPSTNLNIKAKLKCDE